MEYIYSAGFVKKICYAKIRRPVLSKTNTFVLYSINNL